MNLDFLNPAINFLAGANMTPVVLLSAILGLMALIIVYYMTGLAEKIENLSFLKKTFVFLLIAIIVLVIYYVFYKAGKFDELLGNRVVQDVWQVIKGKL